MITFCKQSLAISTIVSLAILLEKLISFNVFLSICGTRFLGIEGCNAALSAAAKCHAFVCIGFSFTFIFHSAISK